MRQEKELIALLRRLMDLLAEEAARSPEFAAKLERLLSDRLNRREKPKASTPKGPQEPLPDIHSEWKARGEPEFRLWLRDRPMPVLRALIRSQDLDPTRRTAKWKEAAKLADFIAD